MKHAIVTGGSGFIGSWLVNELIDNGINVCVIVREKDRLLPEIIQSKKVSIIEKKMNDICELDFDSDIHYDVFFHLAWAGVSSNSKNDLLLQIENIKMSLHALELCKGIGCDLFFAAGTVAEYGLCKGVIDTNARQTPNDMYGAAKASLYYFLEVKARQLNQKFIWGIIPSTYGERRNDNNIITYTIRSLLLGEKPIYGDLKQMWDFLYVKDVAKAIRLIGEKGLSGKIYGIGSGIYKPLREYVTIIRDLINPSYLLGIGEVQALSTQTFSSCVDIDELKADTGFEPSVSFVTGIRRTIDYQRGLLKV